MGPGNRHPQRVSTALPASLRSPAAARQHACLPVCLHAAQRGVPPALRPQQAGDTLTPLPRAVPGPSTWTAPTACCT